MEVFNTRETALGIWLAIALIFATFKRDIRSSLLQLIKVFFQRQIQTIFFLMLGYILVVVAALHSISLWDASQLKNTLLWTVTVALLSTFRVPDIAKDEHYFRNALLDNFKVIVAFEFFVTFYTFSLWIELIVLPLTTLLVMLQAFSERKKEHKVVTEFTSNALVFIGLCMVIFAVYRLAMDSQSFVRRETLSDFAIPIYLSILFLPFLYVLNIYLSYENAFVGLLRIEDATLRRHIKLMLLVRLNFRTRLLKRWIRNFHISLPETRQDVSDSIDKVLRLAKREKSPPVIAAEFGWSPYEAIGYLTAKGLKPGDYHSDGQEDGQWFAISPYLEVGDFPKNNVSYYVEGDEFIARTLRITANFYDKGDYSETLRVFAESAVVLFNTSLKRAAPTDLLHNLANSTPIKLFIDGKLIELFKEAWPSGRGFSLRFIISVANNASLDKAVLEAERAIPPAPK